MAETKRSLSTILANLPDNTTQLISPEDIRDAVITVAPDFGAMYVVTPAATTITDTTTYFPADGTYALIGGSDWDMNVQGQLRYIGAASRFAAIFVATSFTTASNSQRIAIGVAKNGTFIAESEIDRKTGTGSDVGAAATFAFSTVNPNDYFSLAVRNQTSASNVTFEHVKFGALGLAS